MNPLHLRHAPTSFAVTVAVAARPLAAALLAALAAGCGGVDRDVSAPRIARSDRVAVAADRMDGPPASIWPAPRVDPDAPPEPSPAAF